MKRFLFCLIFSISLSSLIAQPGCPAVSASSQTLPCGTNCTNLTATFFNVGSTNTYDVTQITYAPPVPFYQGTSVLIRTDDLWSQVIYMPFNFCFFGQTYDRFIIGSNGIMSFDTTNTGQFNSWTISGPVPANTPSDCDASIMGVWEDIDPTHKGTSKYTMIGTYPCRTFIVSFDSVPYYGDPNSACASCYTNTKHWASSEIVLYETTNVIEIYIREKQEVAAWNGGLAVEGIVNPNSTTSPYTPTLAYTVPGRNATQWTATDDAWRFTPTSSSIVSVNWSHNGTILTTSTGDTAIGDQTLTYNVCPPSSSTVPVTTGYTATAIYNRCDGTQVIETDSITLTTTPSPNAGPDQNLGCYVAGLTATMAATAFTGAAWTAIPGNPSTSSITTPSSPTTTITGFTAPGTYKYLWGSGSCFDTAQVIITTGTNAGPDQTTCQNAAATMAATGTGTWTAQSNNPGTAIITSPTDSATTITGFSASGTYHFIWTNGACTDTTAVIVHAIPNAGADQTVSCAVLPGGNATMAAIVATTTIGAWTAEPGNPGTATITTPSLHNTTITNFSAPGTYYFLWTVNGCSDTAAVIVTAKPNAGPDKTVSCAVLPGGTATMAASGTGTWAAQTGNPGTAIITTATDSATAITTFSAAGIYYFIWTSGGCTDTAAVTVTTKPDAGPDQSVTCYPFNSTATMAASGTGTWTTQAGNPGTATITTPSDPLTTITAFSTLGTYYFIWTSGGCADTATVVVTGNPNAGPDQNICQGGTATMQAGGSGTWSPMSNNPGTAVITAPSSPTTTITAFSTSGTYNFIWTLGGCSDTAAVVVIPKPDAGSDQAVNCAILPGGTATMQAVGTGTWTAQAGNPGAATIVNPTNPATAITTFSTAGTYNFIWTVGGCADTASVIVTAKPNAGPDQTVSCAILPGGIATMAANGTGTWTAEAGNPGTAAITTATDSATTITTFSAPGTYSFIWANPSGCTDTATVTVTAQPNAGPDHSISCIILPGGSVTMAATDSGIWTAQVGNPGTATITYPDSPTTTITNYTAAGTYYFIWTNSSSCADTTSIVVTAKPNAGPDQTVNCAILPGGTATMAATGLGTWTAMSGNPGTETITVATDSITTITTFSAPGVYSFIWTNASGCTDTAKVTVTQEPTITQANASYCLGGNATLSPQAAPAGGTYLWSTGAITPTITTDTTVSSIFTVTYSLGSCSASAFDTVTVNPLPIATVTTVPSVCTANNGLAIANPGAGTPPYTYSWSAPGGSGDTLGSLPANTYLVTVTDINQCTVTASGTVALQTPAITITEVSQHNLKCNNDGTGDIYINTNDTARNSGTYNLTYIWSGSTPGNQSLLNVQAGTYTVLVTDQFGCTGTASYTLTQPAALGGSATYTDPVCFGYANGTASVVSPTGGSGSYHYVWNTNPAQNTQQATGLTSGTYTVSMTDDSLCLLTLTVTLTDPPAITFGGATVVEPSCNGNNNGSILVSPQNGVGTYTYSWSNGQNTNPAINLTANTYTVTATDGNGCFATTTVTVNQPSPVSVAITETNVTCYGLNDGSATAAGSGGTLPFTYVWNTQDTTATISGLLAGTYRVTATDNNGCAAIDSATLTQPAQVSDSLSSKRTSCPNSSDGTISAKGSGGTGSFTFALDSSGIIIDSGNASGTFTGLAYGVYTVISTDQNNCAVKGTITVPQAPYNYYTDTAISTTCYGTQYQDGIIHVRGYTIPNGPFKYSVDGGTLQYTPDFYNLSAGPHTIEAQDSYFCDTTFTVVVNQPPPATLQILPGDSTIAPGASLQLSTVFSPTTDTIRGYAWSPGTGLSCIDCPSPVASPYAIQNTYTLVVTYNQGCVDTATIQINITGRPPLYIPNAFTPNGDGVNDTWLVYGTGIKDIKVTVFDRWGEKVFESDDQSQGWDGTYRGAIQPPGVYVYIVNAVYLDNETLEKNGSLTLIR